MLSGDWHMRQSRARDSVPLPSDTPRAAPSLPVAAFLGAARDVRMRESESSGKQDAHGAGTARGGVPASEQEQSHGADEDHAEGAQDEAHTPAPAQDGGGAVEPEASEGMEAGQ